MHIESFRDYCLSFPGVTEGFPFGGDVLVFKVMGKMFALADVDEFESINLKCEPSRAIELRASYEEITPGYHMNKTHWNTILTRGNVSDELLKELIDHSYELVAAGLSKKKRDELRNLN